MVSAVPAVPVIVAGKAPVTVRASPSVRSEVGVTEMPGVKAGGGASNVTGRKVS